MSKFADSLVQEMSLFVKDNMLPIQLVLIKNKALKWYDLIEDTEEISLHSNKLIQPKEGKQWAKIILESRGIAYVIIREFSFSDCDVELIRFGSSMKPDTDNIKEIDGISEINLLINKEGKFPDIIRKYTVNEDGSLSSYFD